MDVGRVCGASQTSCDLRPVCLSLRPQFPCVCLVGVDGGSSLTHEGSLPGDTESPRDTLVGVTLCPRGGIRESRGPMCATTGLVGPASAPSPRLALLGSLRLQ